MIAMRESRSPSPKITAKSCLNMGSKIKLELQSSWNAIVHQQYITLHISAQQLSQSSQAPSHAKLSMSIWHGHHQHDERRMLIFEGEF